MTASFNLNDYDQLLLSTVEGGRTNTRIKHNGEEIIMDADSKNVKFPAVLDIEISIEEEETFFTTAKRLVTVNEKRNANDKQAKREYMHGTQSKQVRLITL